MRDEPADLSGLRPPAHTVPVENVFDDLLSVITISMRNRPRSQQKRLGPSEIGTPCPRRLAYQLLDIPHANSRDVAWRPEVGSAVHAHLADWFVEANRGLDIPRWLVEFKVRAGEIADDFLDGSCDLYDRYSDTVVDWKVVGVSALKRYRAHGVAHQYRVQAHTYGLGWERRGLHPRHVAICYLPMAGELSEAYLWTEPYDRTVAEKAILRVNGIAKLVAALDRDAPAALPTADAFCSYCPYFLPAATELREACPGHVDPVVNTSHT